MCRILPDTYWNFEKTVYFNVALQKGNIHNLRRYEKEWERNVGLMVKI